METLDPIPFEDREQATGPDGRGMAGLAFLAFGTHVALRARGRKDVCRQVLGQAKAACRAYERLFSRTLPHSDIARLNAAQGEPVAVAPETAALLRAALGYCEQSGGVFDITVGPLAALWDFREGTVPDEAALAAARGHVGWRNLSVRDGRDAAGRPCAWAQLADPLASVDLGGIAKGYIADRLAEGMGVPGVEGFIVDLGGNVVVGGAKPDGSPWVIGVKDPADPSQMAATLSLASGSAVTSGTYERCFERDGRRYHHILDPCTGYPVETDAASATVVARRSIDAEGYSTTLLALGIEAGSAFVRAHPAIDRAVFVDVDGGVHAVDAHEGPREPRA